METRKRKANRSHEEIRLEFEGKRAYHVAQADMWAAKIAKLDEPKPPRQYKASVTSALKAAKKAFSREELLEILEQAREQKRLMNAE